MKRRLTALLAIALLAGCGSKKEETKKPEPEIVDRISISQTDFTQSQAEAILKKAVNDHCGSTACTVTSTSIKGDSIVGTYTYTEEEQMKEGTVSLNNVTVNPNDSAIVYFGSTEFNDGMRTIEPETKPDDTETASNDEPDKKDDKEKTPSSGMTDDSIPHVIIEKDLLENINQPDQVLYDQDRKSITLFYSTGGTRNYTGTVLGEGTLRIVILDTDQKVIKEVVNHYGEGEFSGSVHLEKGFYLQYFESSGAGAELYWQTDLD